MLIDEIKIKGIFWENYQKQMDKYNAKIKSKKLRYLETMKATT